MYTALVTEHSFLGQGLLQPHLDRTGALAVLVLWQRFSRVGFHDGLPVNVRPSRPNIQISMEAAESWHGGSGDTRCSQIQESVETCVSLKSAVARCSARRSREAEFGEVSADR